MQTIVKQHRFPADVHAVEVNFRLDWTGAPVAWISYLVDDDLNPPSEKITRLSKFTSSVQDALLKTHPTYWPHVNIRAIY